MTQDQMKALLNKLRDANRDSLDKITINEFNGKKGETFSTIPLDSGALSYLKINIDQLPMNLSSQTGQSLVIDPMQKNRTRSNEGEVSYLKYRFDHFVAGPTVDARHDSVDLSIMIKDSDRKILEKHIGMSKPQCTSGLCCNKCGRDLTITVPRLQSIFPQSPLIAAQPAQFAQLFNEALKVAGFSTCERQAKLFAQIGHESNNFRAKVEGTNSNGTEMNWGIGEILNYFKRTLGAKKHFFNQSFWDEGSYKSVISANYFETDSVNGTHEAQSIVDYYGVYNNEIQSQYHVRIPTTFKTDTTGEHKVFVVPINGKQQHRKNMFNQAYDGILGNASLASDPNSEDGWKYRGRGAIQLTGRTNYSSIESVLKDRFNISSNLLTDPDVLASDNTLIVYSAVAFILMNISTIEVFDTMPIDQVSALINTGNSSSAISNVNGAEDRKSRYNNLKQNAQLFKCED